MASSLKESYHDGGDMVAWFWETAGHNVPEIKRQETARAELSWPSFFFYPLRDLRSQRDATKVRVDLPS